MHLTHKQFRELAAKHGLAVTHQRQVVYEAVIASHGHFSPEDIYDAVRRRIPSISLATVYNNLRLFIACGLLREVTPHASTLRVDGNLEPHHHLVCSRCKSVQDIEGAFIDFNRLSRQLPDGFDLTQPLIEVFGLCRRCSAKKSLFSHAVHSQDLKDENIWKTHSQLHRGALSPKLRGKTPQPNRSAQ